MRLRPSLVTTFALLVFVLVATAAFGQVIPAEYNLVDANGTMIGRVQATGSGIVQFDIEVTAELAGQPVAMVARNSTFLQSSYPGPGADVFFTSSDCTGQAYIFWNELIPFAPLGITGAPPNFTAYLAPVGTSPTSITFGSRLEQASDACTVGTGPVDPAIPVDPIPLTRIGPFKLEGGPGTSIQAVPALDRWGLVGLAVALGGLAVWWLARRSATAAG